MNKIFIKGRISQDLEVKTSQNNNMVVRFNVAVRNDYKSQNGEYETQFFNCVAFGKTGEFINSHFKKGQEILLTGHLQNNSWETENGEKRISTSIIVETTEFCGNKVEEKKEDNTDFQVSQDSDLPF